MMASYLATQLRTELTRQHTFRLQIGNTNVSLWNPNKQPFFSCWNMFTKKTSLHFNQCNKSPNYLMMNIWTINRQHGFQDFENVSLSWDKFSWHSKLYVPRCCPDPFHLTFPNIALTTNEHLDSNKGPPTHIIYNEWMLSKLSLASTNFCFPKLSG